MSGLEVVGIALLVFLLLAGLTEMHIGIALSIGACSGIVLLNDWSRAEAVFSAGPFSSASRYALFVIPMYILLGSLISNAGIGAGIYRAVNALVGRLEGGLAATAVTATAIFSGISGSSAADVAAFGRISVKEMTRQGYKKEHAAAIVAAAGAFAVLIPPSLALVIYGILAEVSIGQMILAGVIPGILSAVILVAYVICSSAIKNRRLFVPRVAVAAVPELTAGAASEVHVGHGAPRPVAGGEAFIGGSSGKFQKGDLIALLYAGIIFAIVVGGLYGGYFTATESASVGALAALVIALVSRRYRETGLKTVLANSLREAGSYTSMIFMLLLGGATFTFLVASSGAASEISEWIFGLGVSRTWILIIFLIGLMIMGMFFDGLSLLLLTVPFAAPTLMELDVDMVWFGVLMVKAVEIGLITPPVGVNVFIISSLVSVRAERVFRWIAPFVVLDLAMTAVLFAFPEIVMWLPGRAGG